MISAPRSLELQTRMMKRIAYLRRHLTRNKIFLDTIGVLVLSAAGLYLGYQANRIAKSQAELARQQTRLQEAQHLPFIQARIEQLTDDFGARFDQLIFANAGGPIRGFYAQQVSFLQITSVDSAGKIRDRRFYPWFYYGPFELTKAETGTLATFGALTMAGEATERKWKSQTEAVSTLQEEARGFDEEELHIEPCVFFALSYSDLLGDQHEALVHIDDLSEGGAGFTMLPNSWTRPLIYLANRKAPPNTRVPELAELLSMREYLPDPSEVFGPNLSNYPFFCYPLEESDT